MAKHHFAPWSEDRSKLGGFARLIVQEGDAHSTCTHCGVFVKISKGQTTKKFWVDGRLVSKTPPCSQE